MGTPTIKKISVIGSGMMGHAIAEEFAVAGYEVILKMLFIGYESDDLDVIINFI